MMRLDEGSLRSRGGGSSTSQSPPLDESVRLRRSQRSSWRRILLLIIAITVHNIPGWPVCYVPVMQEPVKYGIRNTVHTTCRLVTHLMHILSTEGLAVGVGFGAIGKSPSATLESAR